MDERQQQDFQRRVQRVNANGRRAVLHAGLGIRQDLGPRRQKRRFGHSVLGRAGYPISFLLVALIAAASVVATRYIRLQMLGVPTGDETQLSTIADLLIASVGAWVVNQIMQVRTAEYTAFSTAAVFGMILCFHNFVWLYPDLFAHYFSPDWVEYMQDRTEPGTINLMGTFIPLWGE